MFWGDRSQDLFQRVKRGMERIGRERVQVLVGQWQPIVADGELGANKVGSGPRCAEKDVDKLLIVRRAGKIGLLGVLSEERDTFPPGQFQRLDVSAEGMGGIYSRGIGRHEPVSAQRGNVPGKLRVCLGEIGHGPIAQRKESDGVGIIGTLVVGENDLVACRRNIAWDVGAVLRIRETREMSDFVTVQNCRVVPKLEA